MGAQWYLSETGNDYGASFVEYASDNLSSANSSYFNFVLFLDMVNEEDGDCSINLHSVFQENMKLQVLLFKSIKQLKLVILCVLIMDHHLTVEMMKDIFKIWAKLT